MKVGRKKITDHFLFANLTKIMINNYNFIAISKLFVETYIIVLFFLTTIISVFDEFNGEYFIL